MKDLFSRFEPLHFIILVGLLITGIVGVTAVVASTHGACWDLAHGNIQAYESCVRAERGNR